MSYENGQDPYRDYYIQTKLTISELKQFPGLADKTEEELEVIADQIFDLAILAQKIQ